MKKCIFLLYVVLKVINLRGGVSNFLDLQGFVRLNRSRKVISKGKRERPILKGVYLADLGVGVANFDS